MLSGKEIFCKELDDLCKENSIICIKTYDAVEKKRALNHMFQKGWICVQNDVCATDTCVHYILTFATKEAAESFKV